MEPMIRVGSRQAMYRLICLYQFVPLPLLKALLFAGSTAFSLEQNTWLSLGQALDHFANYKISLESMTLNSHPLQS